MKTQNFYLKILIFFGGKMFSIFEYACFRNDSRTLKITVLSTSSGKLFCIKNVLNDHLSFLFLRFVFKCLLEINFTAKMGLTLILR